MVILSRVLWGLLAAALIAFDIVQSVRLGWSAGGVVIAFAILPDVSLVIAADPTRRGMLRPSRVWVYNAAHRVWIPLALLAIGALTVMPVLLAGAAWLTHIAVDRTVGYGLRAADGSIRPVGRRSAAATPCHA